MDNIDQAYHQMFNNNNNKQVSQQSDNIQHIPQEMFEEQPLDILKNYMCYFRQADNSMRTMKVNSIDVEDSWN